jgi:hypothetical protein
VLLSSPLSRFRRRNLRAAGAPLAPTGYRPGAPPPTAGAGGWISALIPSSAPPRPVLGGPSQTKAALAHPPVPCAWGVGMVLHCPSGTPAGAGASIYQANPIARQSKTPTADFSKKIVALLASPCVIFPKTSQTANESASVVRKHHPVFPPRRRILCSLSHLYACLYS